nr:T9SS type A sorting domain-containing protein [Bacteroidota bacterium]
DMVVCLDTDPFDLTGATPVGGDYTGPGVNNNKFYPAAAGPGVHVITYTYTDPQTECTNFCTFKITVIDIPEIQCPEDFAVCLNDDPFTLTGGTPPGGTYTGPGVTNNEFDPMGATVGEHTITYTIGVPGTNCFAQCEFKITVKPLPQLDCPAWMDLCENDPPVLLDSAIPQGGAYNGNGVTFDGTNYYFDPSLVGVGTYLITYCYTDPNTGCSDCCEFNCYVHPTPQVICPDDFMVCENNNPFQLAGLASPAGGDYFEDGYLITTFDPAQYGPGEYTIEYCYTDPQTQCIECCFFKIIVVELPVVTCPDDMSMCIDEPPFVLTGGTPTGGIYSGPGVSAGMFRPVMAGPGTHTIQYCVANPLLPNCIGCCQFEITVYDLPNTDCPANFEVCIGSPPVELNADPEGGEFIGFNVYFQGGKWYFDPDVSFPGVHVIEYCYTDPNTGCTGCCTFEITVIYDQLIEVNPGWQGISSYIVPDDPDVTNLMYPLGDDLIILFEYPDKFYYPAYIVNTIGNWNTYKGYILKSDGDTDLPVCGVEVFPKELLLGIGWQVIPVLTPYPVDVEALFANAGGLVIVKDVAGGNVYWKDYGINTIIDLLPGVGYFVLMSDEGTITFPQEADNSSSGKLIAMNPVISPWNDVVYTPASHAVAFNPATTMFQQGDIIGGFTNTDLCSGLVGFADTDQPFVVSLNANDQYTIETDGFEIDEFISYKVYRPSTGETFELEATYNPEMNQGYFEPNGLSEVISVKLSATGIANKIAGSLRIYPNPTHGIFTIEGVDGIVGVQIFNTFGEDIYLNELYLPEKLDLTSQPKGVYIIRIENNVEIFFEKPVID